MTNHITDICKNCYWFRLYASNKGYLENSGECHRYPPTITSQGLNVMYDTTRYPIVLESYIGCGEHKSNG